MEHKSNFSPHWLYIEKFLKSPIPRRFENKYLLPYWVSTVISIKSNYFKDDDTLSIGSMLLRRTLFQGPIAQSRPAGGAHTQTRKLSVVTFTLMHRASFSLSQTLAQHIVACLLETYVIVCPVTSTIQIFCYSSHQCLGGSDVSNVPIPLPWPGPYLQSIIAH